MTSLYLLIPDLRIVASKSARVQNVHEAEQFLSRWVRIGPKPLLQFGHFEQLIELRRGDWAEKKNVKFCIL